MSQRRKYVFDQRTLSYKEVRTAGWLVAFRRILFTAGSVALSLYLFWLYVARLDGDFPQAEAARLENSEWRSRIEAMNRRLDNSQASMDAISLRSEYIYRSIFGMNSLPEDVMGLSLGGVNRYSYLDGISQESQLRKTAVRLDKMTAGLFVQSKSLDEIALQAKNTGEMMSCIPAIIPLNPAPGSFRFSSPFGYRPDPISGRTKLHKGVDFATKPGNSVYAPGDGVVETVKIQIKGYGKELVINHGFGYKTRYAHLSTILVAEGMKVKRGDLIARTGNSGKSSGPHLHYEVLYKGQQINPVNFYDSGIDPKEYATMVRSHSSSEFPQIPKFNKVKKH